MKKLLLIILLFSSVSLKTQATNWGQYGTGLNYDVTGFSDFSGYLYACGNGTDSGYLSVYISGVWERVASFNGRINGIMNWGSGILCWGDFTLVNNVTAINRVGLFSGTFSEMGTAQWRFDGEVKQCAVIGGFLAAVGSFTRGLAQLNGGTWLTYGCIYDQVPSGTVNSICELNGTYYIGGTFPGYLAQMPSGFVTWQTISGVNGEVTTLQPQGNDVWVGGKFTAPYAYLSKFTSGALTSAGAQPNNNVSKLSLINNVLWMGGSFTSLSNGKPATRIAKYVTSWDTAGVSFNGDALTFFVWYSHLIAGGKFTQGDGIGMSHAAQRYTAVGIDEIETENIFSLFPNPAKNDFTIKNLSSNKTSFLQILNPLGEIVYAEKLSGKNEYLIDAKFAKGIYFVRITSAEKTITRKLVVE